MENDQTCSEAEKESKHHKEEVNKLEKEKARLKEELSNKVAEISSLQTEISRYPKIATLIYSTDWKKDFQESTLKIQMLMFELAQTAHFGL